MKFWAYKNGDCNVKLRTKLAEILNVEEKKVFLLENGRTAEYIFLKSLELKENSNVSLQGFTCNAVVNPILWNNLKPLYIDINEKSFNMSMRSLSERVDNETKVVVLQHTFGNPVFKTRENFQKFLDRMHERGIFVLEDCAHCLGGDVEGQKLGTFGDAALFSFGIEKVLSTRVGGALVINNEELLEKIEAIYSEMKTVGFKDTFLWLLNPLFWRILRNSKDKMKKAKFLRKFGLLNMGFADEELFGKKPKQYPRKISNALSCFVLDELQNLEGNLSHRKAISEVYTSLLVVEHPGSAEIPFVRFPIVCETKSQKKDLKSFLGKNDINHGDWYEPVIYPKSTRKDCMMYKTGSCKMAENVSSRILNLPTGKNITVEYAREISEKIISFLDKYEG